MFDVDFEKSSPQVICHKDYEKLVPEILEKLSSYDLSDHFILFSSGTTGGDLKGYALSKEALFANASAVNKHFGLSQEDVWGLSLPVYHVGGLSVLARARLLGNRVIDLRKWDPELWMTKLQDVTITTIVPTQLHDLVQRKFRAPEKLRYIIVGGDYLSEALKKEAMELGWPVIRTFGMSEVCSQLASARSPQSNDLEVLPIHDVKTQDERLLVKGQALFTLEFVMGREFKVTLSEDLCDSDGFYFTKDRAKLDGNIITPLGRIGEEFKIAGHLVDFLTLKETLTSYLLEKGLYNKMELSIEDDPRTGKKLVLYAERDSLEIASVEEISERIRPVKIQEIKIVERLDRTALGKFKRGQGLNRR